jgi:hypothetical protein
MQAANATGLPWPELDSPDELELLVPVVVVSICATRAPDEAPPHPAARRAEPVSSAATAANTAVPQARRRREDAPVFVDFNITPLYSSAEKPSRQA